MQNITPDRDPAYASDDELIADIQRQLAITIAAEEAARARGERVPLSGMPGFESWKRSALRAAGETYTIIRGLRVPLDR